VWGKSYGKKKRGVQKNAAEKGIHDHGEILNDERFHDRRIQEREICHGTTYSKKHSMNQQRNKCEEEAQGGKTTEAWKSYNRLFKSAYRRMLKVKWSPEKKAVEASMRAKRPGGRGGGMEEGAGKRGFFAWPSSTHSSKSAAERRNSDSNE